MEVNSIHDLIVWTQRYHEQLEKFYEASADHADEERIQLLLDYFKSHQRRLADTYERILDSEDKKVLNSWCQEYSAKQPDFADQLDQPDLRGMSIEQIIDKVVDAHQLLIDLYYEFASQAHTFAAHDLFNSLLELEENDLMQEKVGAQSFNE